MGTRGTVGTGPSLLTELCPHSSERRWEQEEHAARAQPDGLFPLSPVLKYGSGNARAPALTGLSPLSPLVRPKHIRVRTFTVPEVRISRHRPARCRLRAIGIFS